MDAAFLSYSKEDDIRDAYQASGLGVDIRCFSVAWARNATWRPVRTEFEP
jgi:hypothetical protein